MTDPPFGGGELRQVLPEEDVNVLAEYWHDHRRDETLGDFIQRVAMRAIERSKTPNAQGTRRA